MYVKSRRATRRVSKSAEAAVLFELPEDEQAQRGTEHMKNKASAK
ncbi:hypothetical protein Hanom_Chr16g01441651 [Helianthus anomalus]